MRAHIGWTVGLLVALVGCGFEEDGDAATSSQASHETPTGSVELALEIGGVEIDRVQYRVTGEGIRPPLTGDLLVNGDRVQGRINGIPAGEDRTLTLTAFLNDQPVCVGEASFDLEAGEVVALQIILQCSADGLGSVRVNGRFNQAPVIQSVLVNPRRVDPGEEVELEVFAYDPDSNLPLEYRWEAESGQFIDADAPQTIWIAGGLLGRVHITITIEDALGGIIRHRFPVEIFRFGRCSTTGDACSEDRHCPATTITGRCLEHPDPEIDATRCLYDRRWDDDAPSVCDEGEPHIERCSTGYDCPTGMECALLTGFWCDGINRLPGRFFTCQYDNRPSEDPAANCEVDADCTVERPNVCVTCGNGVVEGYVGDCPRSLLCLQEMCDDGNRVDGDGCSSTCQFEGLCPGGTPLQPLPCATNADCDRLDGCDAGSCECRL